MIQILKQLFDDEAGFIVSAELILVATITVLAMVVGLSELCNSINHELWECAQAFESCNQSYECKNGSYDDWDNGDDYDSGIDISGYDSEY